MIKPSKFHDVTKLYVEFGQEKCRTLFRIEYLFLQHILQISEQSLYKGVTMAINNTASIINLQKLKQTTKISLNQKY